MSKDIWQLFCLVYRIKFRHVSSLHFLDLGKETGLGENQRDNSPELAGR